jgi:nicotinamide-nucleotide amidase
LGVYVEIFAIGNELCYGRVYDTNSFWIADQTTRLGAKVQRITCVPDVVEEICTALRGALDRNPDFIILTGGLGPTSDDLTIESLSKLLGVKIEINNEIFRALAKREGVTADDLPVVAKMARSLKDATCFPNPAGWAPVTLIEKGETTLVALPGPPEEMKACFTEYLAKRISEKTRYLSISKRVLVRMYENQASLITKEIMKEISGTYLKPLVGDYHREMGLPVDVVVFAEDEKTCRLKMKRAIKKLRELVQKKHAQ